MLTQPHWIEGLWPGKLAVSPRPRGGDWLRDEIRGWKRVGVDVVVSLLEAGEMEDLGLAGEKACCLHEGISFEQFQIPDRMIPSSDQGARDLIIGIEEKLRNGNNVIVHCRQGIGRAGMIAAGVFLSSGVGLDTALERISRARGVSVPETPRQLDWLRRFDALFHQPA